MSYYGKINGEGQIIWVPYLAPCDRKIYIPASGTVLGKDSCNVYSVTIPADVIYFNCDVQKKDVDCLLSMPHDSIQAPKENFISSEEQGSLLVSFLFDKPEKVELLYKPRPKRKLKAATNSLTNPPMFQEQDFHKDLVLKCKPEAYSASKEIRLFIPNLAKPVP